MIEAQFKSIPLTVFGVKFLEVILFVSSNDAEWLFANDAEDARYIVHVWSDFILKDKSLKVSKDDM